MMLKLCPYRRSRGVQLECTITEKSQGFTSLTTSSICIICLIPEIIQQVNCKNLTLEKIHSSIPTRSYGASPENHIVDTSWRASCPIIGFDNRDNYKSKCSDKCTKFQPLHRDLSTEELITIPNFDSVKSTDRIFRQAGRDSN